MKLLFVPFKISLFIIVFLLFSICFGQERTTKETKVIVVVNEKSNAVEHIALLANFQKMKKEQFNDKYNHHNFFLGVLRGTYEIHSNGIIPGDNTTIVLYTDRQFPHPVQSFPRSDLAPGDNFSLGNTKTKVIANKKGELILKTEGS